MSSASHSTQTASHWGVYNVETNERGDIVASYPFEADLYPPSYLCGLPEIVRGPLRIQQPYVRAGYLRNREKSRNRGGDHFVAVSWDHALRMVADELQRIKSEFGNEAIYGGSYGWASAGRLHHGPSVLKRFLGLHGGYIDKRGNHSFGAALGIMPYVLGRADITELVVSWPEVISSTKLMVMFGGAALKNTQIDSGGAVIHENRDQYEQAAAADLKFIIVSPSRQDLPEGLNAEWVPIRPNTDVALMLAIGHTLATEGLCDREFLLRYCEGYERFETYLLGHDGVAKSADWASRITGVPPDTITRISRQMAANRTLITTSWSVQRADHGEQPVWMTVTLAAMLGQIGLPGGGFSLGFGAVNGIMTPRVSKMPRPTLPIGPNAIRAYVPVGRVADLLLNPGKQIECFGSPIVFPDIKLLYSVGGNPFHHNSNLNNFLRAWQRPETIIVHEPWWNPAAKHADIVLPATTTMERNDILAHEHTRFWIAMQKVIEPVGKARNDFDILANLAERLGFAKAYTEGRNEFGWLRHMYDVARTTAQQAGFDLPDFDAFWAAGRLEFPLPPSSPVLLGEFRQNPKTNRLNTPSGRIEIFSKTIAAFGYDDCPPHPTWLEPEEWLGSAIARRFPLHLLSNQPATRLHSQLDPATTSRNSKVAGREPLAIHPLDAATRQIAEGDVVRVFNARGAFLAGATIADYLLPGVVQIATGAWYDPLEGGRPGTLEKHGNPNVVTMDKGTSQLSQCPVAQTALVEVEKYRLSPPTVTAFEPPKIGPLDDLYEQ
jgi:biotin/methionine sulfoxide reductase